MHQEMRGLRKGSGWRTFWLAKRAGKQDWVQADTPHAAIRKATLLPRRRRRRGSIAPRPTHGSNWRRPTSPDREPIPAKYANAMAQSDVSPHVVEVLRF